MTFVWCLITGGRLRQRYPITATGWVQMAGRLVSVGHTTASFTLLDSGVVLPDKAELTWQVGAATETELEDKKLRIEDAKNATFAAVEEVRPAVRSAVSIIVVLVYSGITSFPIYSDASKFCCASVTAIGGHCLEARFLGG